MSLVRFCCRYAVSLTPVSDLPTRCHGSVSRTAINTRRTNGPYLVRVSN